MSPKDPMPLRSVRVPETIWRAAVEASERRRENLSDEIRKFLERYGKRA